MTPETKAALIEEHGTAEVIAMLKPLPCLAD